VPRGAASLQSAAVSGDRITLPVRARGDAERGTRNVKRLRRERLVPGVLYGSSFSKAIVVGERDLRAALTGASGLHAILDVVVEGETKPHHAVLKDYQRHPIRGTLTHVDLVEVRLDQPIQASVVVQLIGDSPGARMGGVVQQVTRELRVEALPGAIPEHVEVDVGSLEIGGVLRLEDIPALDGVAFLDDPQETVLATCSTPRGAAAEEVEEVEGEEGAEAPTPEAAAGDEEAAGE
jgi:large subunit ribosomal protein L25